jgi:hypothetical protein
MFRKKSNKQLVVVAALIILLCLVCLVGSTFAIFTNDLKSGTIGVITTAGYIKVDMVDPYDTDKSLAGEVLQFQTTQTSPNPYFEPGACLITQGFKIKNKGDIDVNFHLYVGKDNIVDIKGEPVDIDEFNEAFEVLITSDPTNPMEADPLGVFFEDLKGGAVTDDIYYLVVKMKETADNRFQNKYYDGIGVTVYAVQGNVDIGEE